MPRRLLPLLIAALVSVAGCTTVRPGALPDPARSQGPSAPDAAAAPSAVNAPLSLPPGPAALVRTGPGRREAPAPAAAPGRRKAAPGSHTAPVGRAAPAVPRRARPAAPRAHHPRLRPRSPVQHPAPRPRHVHRPPTEQMRDVCRRADGVAAPDIVRLCHATYG